MERQTCGPTEHIALRSARQGGDATACLEEISMGKKIKLREARRCAAEEALLGRLRGHSRVKAGPAFIASFGEFAPFYRAKIEAYRGFALRAPEQWRSRRPGTWQK